MKSYDETHLRGYVSITDPAEIRKIAGTDFTNCDFGIQIAADGRIWICIDGVAFIRFKPQQNQLEEFNRE